MRGFLLPNISVTIFELYLLVVPFSSLPEKVP